MTDQVEIHTGTSELLCNVREGVATITMNRPDARNAMSDDMTPALWRMIRERGEDASVGAIIITGAGSAFCAGGNVKGMGANRAPVTPEERVKTLKERQRNLTGALMALRKPTIAALPGAAAGAGLAIALACDIRIAAQSAFGDAGYARIGLSGDYGVAWLLTRAVGSPIARELMFTAGRVDSARGERIGLFNRVVPDADLQAEAFALAKSMAAGPKIAIQLMKDNLDEASEASFETALDHEAERMVRSSMTADHHEAVRAFIEKRKPVFAGK